MLRKIMVCVLALSVVLTFTSFVYAENEKTAAEKAQILFELDLFKGIDPDVFTPNLEGSTNRAEAMVMIARALNWVNADDWSDNEVSGFDDVPDWANAHVSYAVNKKITLGVGNNLFGSNYIVTERQLITWFDRALGMGNTWENNANLDNVTALIREDLVEGTWHVLTQVPVDGEKTLIETIIGDNEDMMAIASNAGLVVLEEEPNDENVSLKLTASEVSMLGGGGKTTQITAYVTHGGIPAEEVPVNFLAFVDQNGYNRNQQLSVIETVTGADGKATTVYTTLASDDNKHILIMANTQDDNAPNGWINSNNIFILASDVASLVEGRVIDPFTGEPYPNAEIVFYNNHTQHHISFDNATDENGYYSVAVIPGEWDIFIHFDMGDKNYYSGSYTGSHHDFKADNTVMLRVSDFVIEESKNYTLDTEMGIIKGTVTNLGSHRDIYIYNVAGDTVIANVNADGSFMISLPEGSYSIDAQGGHPLKRNVIVEKGEVTDLGSFSR